MVAVNSEDSGATIVRAGGDENTTPWVVSISHCEMGDGDDENGRRWSGTPVVDGAATAGADDAGSTGADVVVAARLAGGEMEVIMKARKSRNSARSSSMAAPCANMPKERLRSAAVNCSFVMTGGVVDTLDGADNAAEVTVRGADVVDGDGVVVDGGGTEAWRRA